jgi:hydroxymethylpyrimidine kinase / phosphomethylpyrimidine kinase / thiamine-phosphate diphosphorylase
MIKSVWINEAHDADLRTIRGLGLEVYWQQLRSDLHPAAIKINLSAFSMDLLALTHHLKSHFCPIVVDFTCSIPELVSGGERNRAYISNWFSLADILILNTHEAGLFLNRRINSPQSIQGVAHELMHLGCKSVLLLGMDDSVWQHDYWTNGLTSFWLTQAGCTRGKYPEIRTVFSAALTASLSLGSTLQNAIIIAKMYAQQALRLADTTLYYGGFPENQLDLPYLSSAPLYQLPQPFKRCNRLGLYPVVDSSNWVEMLLNLGVKTIQLRIKERTKIFEEEIIRSIALAKKYDALLFINDYWEFALKYHAEAVHLGQSDLDTADIDAIRKQGLLLGVSTHCYYEVARAHALCPSYVAIGPIYPTASKEMPFTAQGIECLQRWQRTLNYPLVAIGGINLQRMPDVLASGVEGIALISAITQAEDPLSATEQLLSLIK